MYNMENDSCDNGQSINRIKNVRLLDKKWPMD